MNMHSLAAFLLPAVLSIQLVAPLAAWAAEPVIRTKSGLLYKIPAGWDWGGLSGYKVTIAHQGTGGSKSPNQFEPGIGGEYGDHYNTGWGTVDRDEERSYPGGVKAHWKAGLRYGMHYAFLGEATVAGKVLKVSILDTRTPKFDLEIVSAAFERIAESVKSVAESTSIFHPTLGIAADPLEKKFWYNSSGPNNIAYRCWKDGSTADTEIFVYPADFKTAAEALADITGHYKKSESLQIGKVQRAAITGGELLWTEQPGSPRPFLAAAHRNGQSYFLNVRAGARKCSRPASSQDLVDIARTLRPWDGT